MLVSMLVFSQISVLNTTVILCFPILTCISHNKILHNQSSSYKSSTIIKISLTRIHQILCLVNVAFNLLYSNKNNTTGDNYDRLNKTSSKENQTRTWKRESNSNKNRKSTNDTTSTNTTPNSNTTSVNCNGNLLIWTICKFADNSCVTLSLHHNVLQISKCTVNIYNCRPE